MDKVDEGWPTPEQRSLGETYDHKENYHGVVESYHTIHHSKEVAYEQEAEKVGEEDGPSFALKELLETHFF